MNLNVVWDGTLARPGGRMLFAPESPRQPAPAPSVRSSSYGEVTQHLRRQRGVMGDRWFSIGEIAALLGVASAIVHSPVNTLVTNGHMEREKPGHVGGRFVGEPQRYRWVR